MSETFAPPKIAIKGLTGFSKASPKNFNSFSIKNPDTAGKNLVTPSVELCALWAVPNASFTNTSPNDANCLLNPSSLSVSSLWNLTFSKSKISPFCRFLAFVIASSPITSLAILISTFSNLPNSFATGFKEYSGLNSPFGLPKCEHKTILQFCSIK